jgi:hypothetical protein
MKNKKDVQEISHTPEGVLVRLKEKIRLALGIDVSVLKILIDRFVSNTFQGVTSSKTHFAKVNIYNELAKNKMTIKVFFKFLKIINIKNVKITVTITTPRGKEVSVSEEINLFNTNTGEGDEE